MEERHKRILQRNRTNLVTDLDPSNLYDGLLQKGVFTQDMIDEIKVGQLGSSCGAFTGAQGKTQSFNVWLFPFRALGPDETRPDS